MKIYPKKDFELKGTCRHMPVRPRKILTNFMAAHVALFFNKKYVMIKSSRKLLPWTAFSIQGHLTQAFIQQTSVLLIQVAGYSSAASALLLFFLLNMATWPIKIQPFLLNNYSCRLSKKQIYLAILTWTLHPKEPSSFQRKLPINSITVLLEIAFFLRTLLEVVVIRIACMNMQGTFSNLASFLSCRSL